MSHSRNLRCLVLKICLVLSMAHVALPSQAQNVVTNASFDTNTSPWTVPGSLVLQHTASDGFDAPGAAETVGVLIDPIFGNSVGIQQCIDLTGLDLSGPLFAQAAFKPVDHDASLPAIRISYSEDSACRLAPVGDGDPIFGQAMFGTWSVVQGLVGTVPSDVGSVRLTLMMATSSSSPSALTRFDDVYFGNGEPVFLDGFEAGDASRWSAEVP